MKTIKFFFLLNIAMLICSAVMLSIGIVGAMTLQWDSSTIAVQAGIGVAIFATFTGLIWLIILNTVAAKRRKKGLPDVPLGVGLTVLAFSLAAINQVVFLLLLLLNQPTG